MSHCSRRAILSALGFAVPSGLGQGLASTAPPSRAPSLGFRTFEESVRSAFASRDESSLPRRVEIGPCDLIWAGLPGRHNDRPFAGFAAGALRIVRIGSEPGPARDGVRLYVTSVDLVLADGSAPPGTSRPLDFGSIPPAPTLAHADDQSASEGRRPGWLSGRARPLASEDGTPSG